jgi:hypothetical protein
MAGLKPDVSVFSVAAVRNRQSLGHRALKSSVTSSVCNSRVDVVV